MERYENRHGWSVGKYVIMPDHVHFFCSPELNAKPLSSGIGKWKEWTSKTMIQKLSISKPVWQREFFDHLIRSNESYSQKWDYVQDNPVRAGLVGKAENWEFRGEIHSL
jgi:putative transposase